MRKFLLAMIPALATAASALAAEGMWTMDNLPRAALQQLDFKPDSQWISKVQRASVRFPGGCSGSFASESGLVLTNHHCVSGCVQQLSSRKNDLVEEGYLAEEQDNELRCPGLELNQLMSIQDVTARVQRATAGRDAADLSVARRAELNQLEEDCTDTGGDMARCDIVSLYHGGQYHLYKYRRYKDVRLVWAPEISIAFFGGDPDNFNFPRYVLDAALLRVYEDGEPATTPDYFEWNIHGANEGDLVFVTGHPGVTQRLLTVAELETERDLKLMDWLLFYGEMRGMLNQYARLGPEQARVSRSQIVNLENRFKGQRGRLKALQDPELFAFKRAEEAELRDFAAGRPEFARKFGDPWTEIATAQRAYRDLHDRYVMIELGRGFETVLFGHARNIVRGTAEREKPNTERLREYRESALPSLSQFLFAATSIDLDFEEAKLQWSLAKLREILGTDAPFVKKVLGRNGPDAVARRLITRTSLHDPEVRRALWEGGTAAVAGSEDPMVELYRGIDAEARAIRERYERNVESVVQANLEAIAAIRFAIKGTDIYPDATATLRLSYGQVRGWREAGEWIPPFTKLRGAYERHTGVDPYALPPRWLEKRGNLSLDQRMNMITTHDIVGGNSGSPVIDRDARLIGLIFDGNIHLLRGTYWYDERLIRAISVDSGFIVESLHSMYDAQRVLQELGVQ